MLSVYTHYGLLKALTNSHETRYVCHDNRNGVLHRNLQSFCALVSPSPVIARKRLDKNVTAETNTRASRKRRRKGNPVVSEETVMYGCESSATLTTDRLQCKLQTRPLVRGRPRRREKQFSDKRKEKVKSGHGPQRGARHQEY
jgi:hypothetical protein